MSSSILSLDSRLLFLLPNIASKYPIPCIVFLLPSFFLSLLFLLLLANYLCAFLSQYLIFFFSFLFFFVSLSFHGGIIRTNKNLVISFFCTLPKERKRERERGVEGGGTFLIFLLFMCVCAFTMWVS